MFCIKVLALFLSFGIVFGQNCQNLAGLWRNQLGSNMTIIHRTTNHITGEYSTAVQSRLYAAVVASNITGTFLPVDEGALLSFTVLFNRGKSLATWVGQCLECDGEETLFTSWVLRSYIQKKSDRWMSTHINQDIFKRVPGNENVHLHLQTLGPLLKDKRSQTCEKNIKAASRGKWVSESGDVLDFDDCHESGVFSGQNQNDSLTGRSDGGEPFTALGMASSKENSIKGWAGHIYEGLSLRNLETKWLSHSFSNNCKDPWRDIRFGITNYTFDATYGVNSVWERILGYVRL